MDAIESRDIYEILIFGDEISRRDSRASIVRSEKAHLDPSMQIEAWDQELLVVGDESPDGASSAGGRGRGVRAGYRVAGPDEGVASRP